MISLQGKTNFFEKRVAEYQKSGFQNTKKGEAGDLDDNVFCTTAVFEQCANLAHETERKMFQNKLILLTQNSSTFFQTQTQTQTQTLSSDSDSDSDSIMIIRMYQRLVIVDVVAAAARS